MLQAGPPSDPATGGARPRGATDRRRAPTPMISRYLFVGRRRGGRRAGERDHVYVDRPGPWVWTAFVLLSALSVGDAAFTLYELDRGGTEANPVMRVALVLGGSGFILLKTALTIFGAGFLCLHKNWRAGRACLWIALLGYVALTVWHLYGILVVIPTAHGATHGT